MRLLSSRPTIPILEDMMHYAAFNKSAHSYLATFALNLLVLSVALAGTVAIVQNLVRYHLINHLLLSQYFVYFSRHFFLLL